MALVIEILGPPRALRDRRPAPGPRGRKTWALLGYLLLVPSPPSRERLAELFFPDADDPRGALRWSLCQLRRLLEPDGGIGGDPVYVDLPPGTVVDARILRDGPWQDVVRLDRLGARLLEGVEPGGGAAFELWVANEDRRLAGAAEAALHEAAQAALADSAPHRAVEYASRLVEMVPLEEAHHVLLVECLRRAGKPRDARLHAARGSEVLRAELGVTPGPALSAAPAGDGSVRLVPAMLETARAAVDAGALDQGLRTLWQAADQARLHGDDALLGRALLEAGRALVHVGQGGDEAGGAWLQEAAACALRCGDRSVAAAAYRELAFVDLQRGRYDAVRRWVTRAAEMASDDSVEMAWIGSIAGAARSDQGHHEEARRALVDAVERADAAGARDAGVFARSFLGRLHLLRRELPEATAVLSRAVDDARACWRSLLPWPEALLAEVEMLRGHLAAATAGFERALVLGQQLQDPCLESIATRGLGLLAVRGGDSAAGYRLLTEAPTISRRLPDSYLWIEVYAWDALAATAVADSHPDADRWIARLEELASRCGMQELLARAMLHRARLGTWAALPAAREIVASVDNPALHRELLGLAGRRGDVTRPVTRPSATVWA